MGGRRYFKLQQNSISIKACVPDPHPNPEDLIKISILNIMPIPALKKSTAMAMARGAKWSRYENSKRGFRNTET